VVGLEDGTNVFGVELLGASGEADEVAKEARDDLALLACGNFRLEWRCALGAKTSTRLVFVSTARASPHAGRIGRSDGL
jgi:hypothetical protein